MWESKGHRKAKTKGERKGKREERKNISKK